MRFHFREATSVFRKTMPFVLLQFAIGVVFAIVGVVYLGLVAWLAIRFFWGDGGWSLLVAGAVMLVGLASFAFVWRLVQRYVLYLVKAGHIAVIAHIVEEGEVPANQLSYGTSQVKTHFKSASALWGLEMVIDAVLKQLTSAVARVQSLLPVPLPNQLQTLLKLLQRSIVLAVGYLDNAILAYMLVDRHPNPWRSARDGVVLYGKTWKPVLGSTIVIVFGMYALAFVLLTLLAPVAAVIDVLPTSLEIVSWLFVAGLVAVVHTGLLKPWVKTVVITTFLVEQRGQTPDSETMAWVEERSDRFSELLEKAESDEYVDEDRRQPEEKSEPISEA